MTHVNLSHALTGGVCPISLKSLEWNIKAHDLFVTCLAKQHYRNESKETLEIVYSFPLSWNSVVTEFAAVINGDRLVARALEKSQAEARYEEHLEKGDAPMMLEVNSSLGIATANLGNIRPGESITLEISWAKMALWDNGSVSISIPALIAERYDRHGRQGGLLPHQQTQSNFLAKYPCTLRFELEGILAQGSVSLPASAAIRQEAGKTIVDLTGGLADRDFKLTVTGLERPQASLFACDGDRWVGYPTFVTPRGQAEQGKRNLCLKVLVDCSGSMSGCSIAQAADAIARLPAALGPKDAVTLSVFGSNVEHLINSPKRCTAGFVRRDWLPAVAQIDADMGGTELKQALQAVTALKIPGEIDSSILLITDGQVWDLDELLEFAKSSGERIFILGVGFSPAEVNLRSLGQESGGACEFVMPAENMMEAIERLLLKIRNRLVCSEPSRSREVHWFDPMPTSLFAGVGFGMFCSYEHKPIAPERIRCPKLGLALEAAPWTEIENRAFVQLAAWAEYGTLTDYIQRAELACRYGLLTDLTNLLLVKERSDTDAGDTCPTIQKIPQMKRVLPDSLNAPASYSENYSRIGQALSHRLTQAHSPGYVGLDALEFDPERDLFQDDFEPCASSSQDVSVVNAEPLSLKDVLLDINQFLSEDTLTVELALLELFFADEHDGRTMPVNDLFELSEEMLGEDHSHLFVAVLLAWADSRGQLVNKQLLADCLRIIQEGNLSDQAVKEHFAQLDQLVA